MRMSFDPTFNVGAISVLPVIQVLIVFWWAFFMESLSGTSSAVTAGV